MCHQGNTALILAAFKGHLEPVQALIKAGADLEAKTNKVSPGLATPIGHGRWCLLQVLGVSVRFMG